MHNVDVYQKERSVLFLEYQKASDVSVWPENHLLYLIFVLKSLCDLNINFIRFIFSAGFFV